MATPNTHYGAARISEMLCGCKHLFFIGIGGVNMSSLAEISQKRGYRVSGSDHAETAITKHLTEQGITVYLTHSAANLCDADAVIYTVAGPSDNPEYREAMRRGIPLISRADYLGYIMTGYRRRIGISGMHGKSTTTSMCAQIFMDADVDPTVTSGAALRAMGGYYRIGGEENFIFEACEYMDSFLDFCPTVAVILNIEMDHVDYFKSMEQIRSSYRAFAEKVTEEEDGYVICSSDDPEVMLTMKDFPGKVYTVGTKSCNGRMPDFYAKDIRAEKGKYAFRMCHGSSVVCDIVLNVPGAHQVINALAAASAAYLAGIPGEAIARGLSRFCGAQRRMEYKGNLNGADLYDDYGHHPTEVRTTLAGAKRISQGRLFCLFQPHTYSRTKALLPEFSEAFGDTDGVFLVDIYAAREIDTLGVSSRTLADAIGDKAVYCPSFRDAADAVKTILRTGDVLVVMGAGNVYDVFPLLGIEGND
ncbi:MAG: UDP-N-acetylmuramate--L-alanine ligase [Clostridia bacterium]|nr:UDP-N-acetylmuramate--L-alanine ligase [Clostridia bacterium]